MRPFHFMKTIPTDSPLYLRRLVRELNAGIDGFFPFGTAVRCTRARISRGQLHVWASLRGEWLPMPSDARFSDVYGREIVASRTVR